MNKGMRHYIVCIGNEGFEAMLEVPDEASQSATMAALKGQSTFDAGKIGGALSTLGLRLRYNPHRNIKSYLVSIDIESELFYKMVQDAPTQELIINKGVEINI